MGLLHFKPRTFNISLTQTLTRTQRYVWFYNPEPGKPGSAI